MRLKIGVRDNYKFNIPMKKITSILLAAVMIFAATRAKAQEGEFTFNTRAWSTNYFATMFYGAVAITLESVFNEGTPEAEWADRIIPDPSLVFPIALSKRAPLHIYGAYHRAFTSPFKHLGDWGIGADASFKPSVIGVYAGAYAKSQEIVFKGSKDNIRGYYFQPRTGILIGDDETYVELGVFYDVLAGCGGSFFDGHAKRKHLKDGFGLDFALTMENENGSRTVLQFSMPLHSFLNKKYAPGCNRKVGYIMLSRRIVF